MSTNEETTEVPPLRPVTSNSVIIEEPGSLISEPSPRTLPVDKQQCTRNSLPPKQYRTYASRRLSGRPSYEGISPSLHSISSLSSLASSSAFDVPEQENAISEFKPRHQVRHHDRASHIVSQVAEWLHNEKTKKAARKPRKHGGRTKLAHVAESIKELGYQIRNDKSEIQRSHHGRTDSDISEGSLSLDELERILFSSTDLEGDWTATPTESKKNYYFPLRKSPSRHQGYKKFLRKSSTIHSSDTDCQGPDIDVPSAEVVLDNSKTLSYTGGIADSESDLLNPKKRAGKDKEAWLQFKYEIIRLTHTLRLKRWRRLSLERSGDINVERLSGALTNAVYVVSPPSNLPKTPSVALDNVASLGPKKPPSKLLLRIYGPQVEHLIDRKSELQILRRLARKRIGPRLLGTFTNGRFEQFFHAKTLTAKDLRTPETSKHIAKRMRELHDGIELHEEEREEGAFVWCNWDRWKERCEEVISYLDHQILAGEQASVTSGFGAWKKRGLVCGVEWSVFRSAVRKYRDWLSEQYGGTAGIKQNLVFAHNDTQYGNLLRLEPSGESPLLLPANQHKQLIVIDFEYASANVPGLEFANHFTEWCYNYHESKPYALNANAYPTPKEQERFFQAYIQHRSPIQTRPTLSRMSSSIPGPSSSISSFMLDSRAPPAQIAEEERKRDEALESEVKRLFDETRMWRIANSAQWVAWGIVQAKVPGMDEALEAQKNRTPKPDENLDQSDQRAHLCSDPLSPEMTPLFKDAQSKRPETRKTTAAAAIEPQQAAGEESEEDEAEEFDYLGYAQERAMFFWGDVLQLGIVKKEELPQELLEKVKIVEY